MIQPAVLCIGQGLPTFFYVDHYSRIPVTSPRLTGCFCNVDRDQLNPVVHVVALPQMGGACSIPGSLWRCDNGTYRRTGSGYRGHAGRL